MTVQSTRAAEGVFIAKDQKAPYDGYLFTEDGAQGLRKLALSEERYHLLTDSLQKTVDLQRSQIDIQEQRVELYRKQNDELAKSLTASQSMSNFERIAWFGLGILGAGFAIYGVTKVTK
jgi:hypothetical protein